ncbi:PAS and ANTAR domain-containing protein [Nocardia sp. NPDC051321]|uniref:PAS and ANTAR domain-containing protein n=1 Tax=Nocardia sp. NPDC051321 TaxID=3364323 RepID=UPI00378E9FC9
MLMETRTDADSSEDQPITSAEPRYSPLTDVPQPVGAFRFWFADERWEWSDEVARMHGYVPESVRPTTKLLLSHKHPADRAMVADTLARSVENGAPFSSRHRIIDTQGREHHVIVVGDRMVDDTGRVVGTRGYYIDVTDALAVHRREILDATVPDVFASRAVIEQAKGVLMRMYRVDAEQAFRILRWRSQETNVKLRLLAQQIIDELDTVPATPPHTQSRFDHLLLTAHLHVPPQRDTAGRPTGPA